MAQDMTGHDGATTEAAAPVTTTEATDVVTTEHVEQPQAHSSGFPPFNAQTFSSQLIWLVIIFGVLYVVMARVALPRIAGVLGTRRDRIASDLENAGRAKAQSDEAIASYEKALAEAKARAHTIAQATRDQLAAETEAKRVAIEAQLNDKIAKAEAAIKATKDTALSNVRTVAVDVAGAIVSRLLGEEADKAATERAVDAALKG